MDRNQNNLGNLLPLLGAMTNGNTMNTNQNFINQLVNAISSAVGAANSSTATQTRTATGSTNNAGSTRTTRFSPPEAPPPPTFDMNSQARMKPNRGTAPMDIENESESPNNMFMNGRMPPTNAQAGRGNNGPPAGGANSHQQAGGFNSRPVDIFAARQASMNTERPGGMNAPPPISGMNAPQRMGNMNAPPPMGNMNAPPPLGNMNAPPPMANMNAPPPMVNMNVPPPVGAMMKAPPQMGGMNSQQPMGGMNTQPPVGIHAITGMNPPPPNYMYLQAEAAAAVNAATTSAAATQAANQMFMDPTTMLAAMQQMQQNYASNFTLPNAENTFNASELAIMAAASKTIVAGMKQIIKTKNCVLYPPSLTSAPPSIRERPPGCRTVFVGGLPENFTEEVVREVFEACGEISTLRLSKKNFCHIRYSLEESVERAIYLSGYRMTISDGKESTNSGRLHVDYAQARDDLYDFECKQRQLQREQRHRDHPEKERTHSVSPPPIPLYNDNEVVSVSEQLRNNDTFIKAVQTMAAWLERGDCTKRNANTFYSLIQSTHAHVRRLHTEKQQMEEDLRKARESYRKQMLVMIKQFTQIEKVFSAASHKKVWDHFSKAQRKNIDQWKKLALELRSVQIEDDEMEMSDDDRSHGGSSAKRMRYDADSLKEENDTLRCQLEALRSEMSHDRTDLKHDSDYREKQIKVLQEAIRNMQTQLIQTKVREQKDNKFIQHLERKLKEANVKQLLLKTKIKEATRRRRDRDTSSDRSSRDDRDDDSDDDVEVVKISRDTAIGNRTRPICQNQQRATKANSSAANKNNAQVIDIDDDVIFEDPHYDVVEIHDEEEGEGKVTSKDDTENMGKSGAENDDKQQVDEKNAVEHATGKEVEAKLSEEKADSGIILNDGKTCVAEVETKVTEKSSEIEPKFLPFVEAQIIALTAAYLIVQPFGIKTESICAYLRRSMDTLDLETTTLEQILGTYTNLFQLDDESQDNVQTESKALWKFCGFTVTNIEPVKNGKADVDKKE